MVIKDDRERFYPKTIELIDKVEVMHAYINSLHTASEIYQDLLPFVESVISTLKELKDKEIEIGKLTKSKRKSKKLSSMLEEYYSSKRHILVCFEFFEHSHPVYIRGAYTDFELDHLQGMSFASSFRLILNTLNCIIRHSFLQINHEWPGFVTFSNTLNYKTAQASIIFLPFMAKQSIEWINDWLIITHEMGHIYFWNNEIWTKFNGMSNSSTSKLLDEILADLFSLEIGYGMDIIRFAYDFNNVKSMNQNPGTISFFMETCDIRKITVLVYSCCTISKIFRDRIRVALQNQNEYNLTISFLRENIDLVIDVIKKICPELKGLKKSELKNYLEVEFLISGEMCISEFMCKEAVEEGQSASKIERIFIGFIVGLVTNEVPLLKEIKKYNYNVKKDQYMDDYEQIVSGYPINKCITYPFPFLRGFLDYCDLQDIDLRSEKNAHIRVAFILSLSSCQDIKKGVC